ncbi:MAG: hypothetical protein IKL10_07845 [Clostridia bacterium]|nr:hypothetical protein [Clostridia bacterium]
METINNEYLGKHKKFRIDSKKLATAFIISAFVVAVVVFWWLKLVGVTVTGEAFCGLDEHIHTDECYTSELICEADEAPITSVSGEETSETHTHSEECYSNTLSCIKPEHTHTKDCFPDKSADVETVSDWLSTIESVEITNNIPENLIGIAMSQMGYEESQNNFEYDSDGSKNGYTRYGEWYGNPYGKWNTMFVSFCLHYANINNADELKSAGAEAMRVAWQSRYIYSPADEYTPQRGDIAFLDNNGDGVSDAVGIILSVDGTGLVVICGDSNNKVETLSINCSDSIVGYGLTGELSFARDTEYESEITETGTDNEATTEFETPPLMMFSTGSPRANITYIEDLTLAIANVVFRTEDGEVLDNGSTVYIGQTYVVSLEFSEINTGDEWIQFQHNDKHILHYQIPEYLHCEPFKDWHPITAKTENGTIENVGEYFVDEHGYLRVRFFDDENGVCFGSKYSNVDFVIDFNATVGDSGSGSSTEIEFGNEIKVELNVDGGAGMTVTKTHGEYDSDNHTMEYTIMVKATNGVVDNLLLTDTIWKNHTAQRNTIVVTDLNGNVLDPQPVIGDNTQPGAEKGFTLTGFPAIKAGEGFLITYKSQILDAQLNQELVYMYNSVVADGTSADDSNVSTWTEDEFNIELEKMEKDGSQTVIDPGDGTAVPVIKWTVEIKKNKDNLHNTVIIDTLGEGLSYYTKEDILIKAYDEWGNGPYETNISWDQVTINGNSMSFSLPEGHAFEIIYYSEYEDLAEGEKKNYTNTVSAYINGKQETAGGDADVIGFVPHITKSASGNDGKYVYFTIEADVPAVIKDWGNFYLTDQAAFWGYDNDVGFLYVENIPEDMEITAVTESGRVIEFTPYVAGGPIENTFKLIAPAQGNQYHSFNVVFNTSDTEFSSSKWMLNEDSVLTITYKLPFGAKTGTEWTGELNGDKKLEDILAEGFGLSNQVFFNYTDVIQGMASSYYDYSPKITKQASVNEDGTIDYTVVFHNTVPGSNGNEGYLAPASAIVFNDTFDERLEYVEGSLVVTCTDPWRNWIWLNKYQYNGQISGNSMAIRADELIFSQFNYAEALNNWGEWPTTLQNYQVYCNNMAGGDHTFTYTLKIKDEYLETAQQNIYNFDNTAEITWADGGSSGTASEETEYRTGLIDKHVVQENNNLEFDIHINQNALDILPGTDTLTIEDTMTQNLSVYWDSIKLLYQDANGNWIDFDSADSIYEYTVTYDQASNKLTFVVPDSLHMRIDYTTLITENGLVSVNNSVKIDGKAQVSDIVDAIFKVQEHSGGASGSMHSITLLKQDGDTDMRLADVGFHLYGPMGDPHAVLPEGTDESIVTDGGKYLHYIGTYVTGADGTVKIETQYLTIGGPYALVEVSPPEGYTPLEKPVYFYFYEPDPNGIIQTVTTIIAVENYTYGFVFPETGGTGILLPAIIGSALTASPILYSIIRRKRERRLY